MSVNFKKISVSIILTLIILSISILPVISASSSVSISVTFKNPIVMECVGKIENGQWSLTAEESEKFISAVSSIVQTAYDAFIMDNPKEAMWIDINASAPNISFSARTSGNKYIVTSSKFDQVIKALPDFPAPKAMEDQLEEVIDKFVPEGTSMYDKVRSIHDYVCYLNSYDDSYSAPNTYSAYGALMRFTSVCEGYAEAFKLLCDKNGIECILVSGSATTSTGTENHMWNYVRMDDGKWYAVDLTWDDGKTIGKNYFLVGSETIVNSKKGTMFKDNHFPDGDISNTSYKVFDLPTLSKNSYEENNDITESSSYTSSTANRYYYNQLNAEQKNIYDVLLTVVPPLGTNSVPSTPERPVYPVVTETTAVTTTAPEDTVTAEETTAPEDTTVTVDTTTASDTTVSIQTTAKVDTTVNNQTTTDVQTTVDTETTVDDSTSSDPLSTTDTLTDTDTFVSETSDTETEGDSTLSPVTGTESESQTAVPTDEKISVGYILRIALIVVALIGIFFGITKIVSRVKD